MQFLGGPKFRLLQGIKGLDEVFLACFLAEVGGLFSLAFPRFFIDDEGRSRGLTLLLRELDLEDSGLVFIMCLFLLLLGDGFNNVACKNQQNH